VNITEEFTVERNPQQVWELFCNVAELSRCLPGAELTDEKGDGVYGGNVEAKLGPMSTNFFGECTVVNDHDTMTGKVSGKGVDKAGGSVGLVEVAYAIAEKNGGSHVTIDADVTLSGPVAQFGRSSIIHEMSTRLIDEFADCIEAKLIAETPEAAQQIEAREVKGVSLFFASLWTSIKNWFKRMGDAAPEREEEEEH
jgi:carbon monoxide dehydrogenase subunit G